MGVLARHGTLSLSLPFLSLSSSHSKYLAPAVEHRGMYINGEYRCVTHFEMAYCYLECDVCIHVHTQFGWLSHQPVIYSDLMRSDMFNKYERGAKKGQFCSSDCRRRK